MSDIEHITATEDGLALTDSEMVESKAATRAFMALINAAIEAGADPGAIGNGLISAYATLAIDRLGGPLATAASLRRTADALQQRAAN